MQRGSLDIITAYHGYKTAVITLQRETFISDERDDLYMTLSAYITFPVIMVAGSILFLCLIGTAALGSMILKGKGNIPFSWHVNLARLTIVIALIHGFLAMAWFFGW
jgi:hypothetical protein